MIINNGPIGEKFNALKHIMIKPAGSSSYVKFENAPSSVCRLAANQDDDNWYIVILSNCKFKLSKKQNKVINIACIGGGGGGAGCRYYLQGFLITGGGGNGGQITTTATTLVKNQEYSLTVGAGGKGGYFISTDTQLGQATSPATKGGNTSFDNILTALGGTGGFSGAISPDYTDPSIKTNNYSNTTCTGKGGYGAAGNTTGNKPIDGEDGKSIEMWSSTTKFAAGGGGGAPATATIQDGGTGGNYGGGNGGKGNSSASANFNDSIGNAANGYGSGGGGGGGCFQTKNNKRPMGGDGYQGVILLKIPKP